MRLRWVLVAVIAAAVAALVAVVNSPLMAVDRIDIRGADHADVAGVVAEEGVGPGAILLWVDTGALHDAIVTEPWVSEARVTRVWPRTIEIEVVERRPVLWIDGVLGWMLVAGDGTVLERASEPGPGLMRAEIASQDWAPGDSPDDQGWRELVDMALVLSEDIGSTLVVEMRGSELWTVAGDHEVRLGLPIDLADKGRVLVTMFGQDLPGGAIIDVSSPERPAVVPIEAQLRLEGDDSQG